MRKKKQYTFTLNKDLISWFREYSDTTGRTMSSLLNSYILRLKHENKETKKVTTMDKHLGGKTGLNKDKIAPVKGQKEFNQFMSTGQAIALGLKGKQDVKVVSSIEVDNENN